MGWYERYDRLIERLRILRHQLRERLELPGLLWQLARARRDMLGCFLVAGAMLTACDWAFARYALPWLWRHDWYRWAALLLPFPDAGTVGGVLSVIIGVLGGVIALLIAISLLVIEVSADRYTSRLIRFFLRERYGGLILNVMILTLLLALWAAFLQRVIPFTPFLTVWAVIALATFSVASLLTYRTYAILASLPGQAFNQLGTEARRLIAWAGSGWHGFGRSVDQHFRDRVQDAVSLMAHFTHLLIDTEREEPEQASGIAALGGVLSTYIRDKGKFKAARTWFPTRHVPMRPEDSLGSPELIRPYRQFALGVPRREEPDTEWLETLILRRIQELAGEGLQKGRPDCAVSAAIVLPDLMKLAWDEQEEGIFFALTDAIRSLIMKSEFRAAPDAISSALQGLGETAYHVIEDTQVEFDAIVSSLRWRDEIDIIRQGLPRIVQDVLLDLHAKISIEYAAHGRRITPNAVLLSEATREARERIDDFQKRAYDSIWSMLCELSLEVVAGQETSIAPSVADVLILTHRRPGVRQQTRLSAGHLEDCLTLVEWLMSVPDVSMEAIEELFEEIKEATFESVQQQDADSFRQLLPRYIDFAQMRYSDGTLNGFDLLMSSLAAVGGFALGTAEFYQEPGLFHIARSHLAGVVNPASFVQWLKLFLDYQAQFHMTTMGRRIMEYHPRFVDLVVAIGGLPEVPVERPPAMSYDFQYDHPSPFIQRFPDYGHSDEFMQEFVSRTCRPWLHREIIRTLEWRAQAPRQSTESPCGGDTS